MEAESGVTLVVRYSAELEGNARGDRRRNEGGHQGGNAP